MSDASLRITLSRQERDLIRTALEVWHVKLQPTTDSYVTSLQRAAGAFTQRRINEMLDRIKEDDE